LRHAFRNDFAGALADLDHADALSSKPIAESLVRRARLLASLGRLEEAVILDRQAMAADPRSVAWTVLGWHYLALGDLGNARRVLEHDATLRPDSEHTQFYLGMIDIFEGHAEAALSRFEQSSGPLRLTGTVIARHELGDGEAMRSALATLQQRYPDAGAYQIAEARAWIGDIHGAFAALDHAEQVKDAGLTT
jgi:Tfp pilus assembly protein PilF